MQSGIHLEGARRGSGPAGLADTGGRLSKTAPTPQMAIGRERAFREHGIVAGPPGM
jgi:hypothetical protein